VTDDEYLALIKSAFPVPPIPPGMGVDPEFWFAGVRGFLQVVGLTALKLQVGAPPLYYIYISGAQLCVMICAENTPLLVSFDSGVVVYGGQPASIELIPDIIKLIQRVMNEGRGAIHSVVIRRGDLQGVLDPADWAIVPQLFALTITALGSFLENTPSLTIHHHATVGRDIIDRERQLTALKLALNDFVLSLRNEDAPMPLPQLVEIAHPDEDVPEEAVIQVPAPPPERKPIADLTGLFEYLGMSFDTIQPAQFINSEFSKHFDTVTYLPSRDKAEMQVEWPEL